MIGILNDAVILMPRVEVDDDELTDGPEYDWPDGDTVPASVQPVSEEELEANRDLSSSDVKVFADAGITLDSHDRFRWQGRTFDLIGPSATWRGIGGEDYVRFYGRWAVG